MGGGREKRAEHRCKSNALVREVAFASVEGGHSVSRG